MTAWTPRLRSGGGTKQRQLTDAIVADIERGALPLGTRLPPQRELADRLGLSVQTVGASYKEAERRGYLRGEVGRGTFVRSRGSERAVRYMLDRSDEDIADLSIVRAVYTERHEQASRVLLRAMAEDDNSLWMRPCRPVAGSDRHREAGQAWLSGLGLTVGAEQILLTGGAAQGVFVALATVVKPGDVVLTEALTDHGVIGLASVLGFTLRGLPTDAEGIVPEAFAAACAAGSVKALVCIPSFGNPARYLAGAVRREEIARIAGRHGVFVIEDEVYRPLLAEDLPSITSFIPELGFFATSFTKSVMTGLRVGYLAVPQRFAIRAVSVLRVSAWSAAPILGEMAARWLADGTAAALLEIQRAALAERQALAHGILGEAVAFHHPHAPSVWVSVPRHWTEEGLVRELLARGVAVAPSEPFLAGAAGEERGIRLCLGGRFSPERLAAALATVRRTIGQAAPVHEIGAVGA